MPKKWWKSKTLWANAAGAIIGTIANAATAGGVDGGTVAIAMAALNAALRLLTKQPLTA